MTLHTNLAIAVLALASCWRQTVPIEPTTTPPPSSRATVEISSVTLADDCGAPEVSLEQARSSTSVADCKGDCRASCEQTTLQLSVRSKGTARSTAVRVSQVELLDANGTTLGMLAARAPSHWSESGVYTPWDQTVGPNQTLSVSYALSAPDWGALGGRSNGGSYVVRVTLVVGAEEVIIKKDVRVEPEADMMIMT